MLKLVKRGITIFIWYSSVYFILQGCLLSSDYPVERQSCYQLHYFPECVFVRVVSFPVLSHQVHIHRDLHLRVPHKDPGQGLLCGEVHFPPRSMELAGFQCYLHGVSIMHG